MNNKLRVFVRCRPLRGTESRANINIDEDHGQICVNENRSFQFDDVFSEDSKQIDVYMIVVSPLVNDILLGYNCSVFAYGPTGTGKTFTMEGETIDGCGWEADSLCGIIPRTISQLFETLEQKSSEYYEIKVSFLELYNEEAYDLLSPKEDTRKLKIYDNGPKQIVDGLQEVLVTNRADLHTILLQGSSKRATAVTQLNACSSRSHTIFTITVTTSEGKNGRINLIDLAGSENIGRSGAQDIRAREAGSINQSLLTLGRVIKALVEKAPHIPYRESKLTRLLQNSLGGTTRTSLIATISPSNADLDDTLNTLEYATRAKGVTNKVVVNQSILSVSANQANEIIENLKNQLLLQEYKIRNEVAKEYRKESDRVKQYFENRLDEEIKEFTQKINEYRSENQRLKDEITVLKELVDKPPIQDCSPIVTPQLGTRKVARVKKNILDVSGDYANVTFNNEDEIAQVDNPRSKKKVISCARKREINQAITLSGKKRKLQSQDEQVELSPPVVTKRVTRSRKKLVY